MEISVEPGKTYAVTTSGSCTVTDADGLELCTASSGSQAFFVATTPTVITSDNKAKVSRANFSCALARRSAGGGSTSNSLPAGYTAIEYLEGTGTQYIVGPGQIHPDSSITMKLRPDMTKNNYVLFGCNVAPRYRVILNSANNVTLTINSASQVPIGVRAEELEMLLTPNQANVNGNVKPIAQLTSSVNYWIFGSYNKAEYLGSFRLLSFSKKEADSLSLNLVPAINPNGAPCMYDTVTGQSFTNSGSGRFIAGLSGLTALSNLLLSLPHHETAGSILDVRLPDNVNEEEVTRLCDLAGTYKNWQIVSK